MVNSSSAAEPASKISPGQVISLLVLGSLAIVVIGFVYEWFLSGMSGEFVRWFAPLGYGFILLFLSAYVVVQGGVAQDKKWALFCGIWCGLFSTYVLWIFFLYFLKGQMFILPGELWSAIADVGDHGYKLRGATSTGSNTVGMSIYKSPMGFRNYIFWSIEAAIIMTGAIVGALMNADKKDQHS
jgi:hypothetical protein